MDSQELQKLKNQFDIVGADPSLNLSLETAVKFAPTDLPVLITGESGVGKENIARIIHQYSLRRGAKFIPVNCGGIPEGTINSELFGHVRGAFTGATESRAGYFEEAAKGTIFLDEIGEMPLASQALLLRVLQSGEYMKVGSSKIEHADVRIIVATNVNLQHAVSQGKFREDLYYRICAAQIRVPALRERRDDIYLLFRKFSSDFAEKYGMCKISLTHDAVSLIRNYRWPGNIRQLQGFTSSVTALESQKITPTSGRIELSAANLLPYMPKEEGETLPAIASKGGDDSFSSSEKQMLVKAILDLKGEVDRLKETVFGGAQAPNALAPVHHDEAPDWQQGEDPMAPEVQSQEEHEDGGLSVHKAEEDLILKALEKHGGNRKLAAKELGISERTLYRKLPDNYRGANKKKS